MPGDNIPMSMHVLIEHGRGLHCGLLPPYKEISSGDIVAVLTGEFEFSSSSKFMLIGAIFMRRCTLRARDSARRVAGERPPELMVNELLIKL